MTFRLRYFVRLAFLVAGFCERGHADEFSHFGPAFDEFELTLAPGHRTEAAGPFYYDEQKESQRIWAVPPLFSYTQDKETEYVEIDFAYPIITYDRFGKQYRFQIFQLFSFAGGPTQTEAEKHRFTLFPFFFLQRSSDPRESYMAFLPFYGDLKHRLFRDEVFFIMMPLYVESRKKDVVTDNYVYPFFHLRHGDGLTGWQFWPVVGREHKSITTQTNGFGDVKKFPGHDSFFVLWPFYFNEHTGIGSDNPQWQQGSLPAYDFLRSPLRDSTTVLWPFFTLVNDREKKYREWQVPWPFVIIARGPGKTTTRVLPLFGRSHSATLESTFYLWPLYKYNRAHLEPADRERTRILFFLYSDSKLKNTETGKSKRRVDLWPFFTHQRDFNGNTRLQVLSVLEPYLPNSKSIARDYSQVWSIWRSEKNPGEGRRSQSLLWNLYRHDVTPRGSSSSALFGAFRSESSSEGKTVRVFHFPIKRAVKTEHEAAQMRSK